MSERLLADLRSIVNQHIANLPGKTVAICYGSTVRSGSEISDIDMLIIEEYPSNLLQRQNFIGDLIALHLKELREIDTEVPYMNKLFYTYKEVESALTLLPFTDEGSFNIKLLHSLSDDDSYFSSKHMKLRLCLNALTSKNVFLAGDIATYNRLLHDATSAFAQLVVSAIPDYEYVEYDEVISKLVTSGLANENDYLGYHTDDETFRKIAYETLDQLHAATLVLGKLQ